MHLVFRIIANSNKRIFIEIISYNSFNCKVAIQKGGRPSVRRSDGAALLCGSLCLSGLCLWLTSGVPESGNVEGIPFDIIDNLVEPTYYDAAVGLSNSST